MDPLTAAGALAALYLLARWMKRRQAPVETAPAAPPAVPAPRPAGRPVAFSYPLFTPVRGAHRTSHEAALAHLAARPGPLFELANTCFPAREHLNKLLFVSGQPGAGKTTLARMAMASLADLFAVLPAQARAGLYPGEGKMRWMVTDPTNAYLPHLYRVLPPDIPIVRLSPQDRDGVAWDIAKDVTSSALNEAFQKGLFPDSQSRKSADPFWTTKGREVTQAVVTVFLERRSDWDLRDLVVPVRYPQFLKPLLRQSPKTRGMTKHELVGRLGRDIIATCSATINGLATAAALWSHAKRKYSLREFLDERAVAHFAFTPDMAASLAGVANAMSYVMILLAMKREAEFNHTIFWGDEARYLKEVTGLEDIAARGRGCGLGAVILAQGIPGLMATWGEARVRELTDLVNTWICLRSGHETAELFSKTVGEVEGIQKAYSYATTHGRSETYGTSRGGSSSSGFGGGSSAGMNWGTTHSVTTTASTTYTESFSLNTKRAVLAGEVTNLPLANPHSDTLSGFVFAPDVGAFGFTSPFVDAFAHYPPAPFPRMAERPDDQQALQPWKLEDVRRLGLTLTPAFLKALHDTWGKKGMGK